MKILIVRTFPSIMDPNKYNMQEIGLAKALTRAGHTCGIVLYYGKNEDVTERIPVLCGEETREITVYRLHGYNILKNGFFPSLHKITKMYDVIQVHEYDQITSWFYYAWSKRLIIIYHGPYYHPYNKRYNFKCKIFDQIFLRIKKNKDVLCFTKSHAAAAFLETKGFRNVHAVGVGLDTENFGLVQKNAETSIPIPKDKFNLLYVGKIEERRNSYFLLDVMKEMCKRNENINCVIIGDGEKQYTEEFLSRAQELLDTDKMQYYASASQTQLKEVYQQAQVMLFPTNYDIFGMVLLEAMYFNLPIISSQNGGSDMLIRDKENGIIVTDYDVETWCEQIEVLCMDTSKYQKMVQNIMESDKNTLFWDAIAKVYEERLTFTKN